MTADAANAGPETVGPSDLLAAAIEFNVGLDVENVRRFSSVLEDATLVGLFTLGEHAQCATARDAAGRHAGLWRAKEAAIKASWPWVRLDPRRIDIVLGEDPGPRVVVSGWDPADHGLFIRVSVAYSRSLAVANAIAWGPPISPEQDDRP